MIHFFYGDEEFNISSEISKYKSQLDKNFIEMSYKEYVETKKPMDFATLISVLRTQPMMFGKMLIVINCLSFFSGKKSSDDEDSGFDAKQLDEISNALDNCDENVDIIFVAKLPPDNSKKIDKRKKIFKILSKYDAKEFAKIPEYLPADIEAWLLKYAKSKDINLPSDIAKEMVFQIGGNLRLLSVELEKLYVFANKKNITKSMVNEICTNKQDLFLFMDYVVNGQTIKAIEEYNKLLMVSHPLAILSTLQKTLHSKILIKNYASKMSNDDIAKIIGMHPYRVKIEMGNLKNVSLKRLVQLKRNLTNAEFKIKTGQSIEMEKEIEYAILQ